MALSDIEARRIIVSKLKKNIFVVAGAGSGKTTILITRMVRMVEEGFDITKFCTITFTVNAAAEFLNKFRSELQKRSIQTMEEYSKDEHTLLPPPTDLSRSRCLEALKNIDLAFMGTIDSFCQLLVSEHPYEARVPSSSTVILDEELAILYQKEFDNIINRVGLYDDSDLQKYLTDFLKINERPSSTFQNAINEVINASCLSIQYQPSYSPNIKLEEKYEQIISIYREDIVSDLRELYQYCEAAVNFPIDTELYERSQKAWKEFVKYKAFLLGSWDINKLTFIARKMRILLTGIIFSDNPELYITKPFKTFKIGKSKLGTTQKFDCFRCRLDKEDFKEIMLFEEEVNNLTYDYSLPFLARASSLIQQKFKKEGKLSFNQWLLCIKELLEDDKDKNAGKLINHITDRYQYFMLDESQDTSPFQTTIFELLTEQNKGKCTLFIVGDPKQSIYRFRGADEETYLRTRSKYHAIKTVEEADCYDDIQVELLRNFRSSKEMKQYFNATFKDLANYEQIEIPEDEEGHPFSSGAYKYEPSHLVDIIIGMINNSHYQTYDRAKKGFRTLEYRDFMVITHKKNHQKEVVEAFSEKNIPFYLEGRNDVSRYELVKSAYAIYAYVTHLDQATFINLLTSSFIGLSPEESLMISRDNNFIPLIENKEKQIDFINQLVREIDSFTPLSLYHRIVENIGLFSFEKIEKIDYLFFIEEKIKEALSASAISSLEDGELFLRDYLASSIERYSSISFKPNAVYLANLHKVKGLESPVVFLVTAKQMTSQPTFRLNFLEQKSYLFKMARMEGVASIHLLNAASDLFKEESEKEKEMLKKEEERLQYVAATRAKDYLFVPNDGRGWKTLPVEQDFNLLARKEEDAIEPIVKKPFKYFDINFNFDNRQTYILKKPSSLTNEYKIQKASEETVADMSDVQIDSEATIIGTIVHRLMERIALSLPHKIEQEDVVSTILSEYNLQTDSTYEDILNSVFETIVFKHGYEQELGNAPTDIYRILLEAQQIICEVPFCYKEDNVLVNGFIDLVYLDENGYHIIDYKTDALLGEHQAQLDAYIKALKVLFNIEADAKIYHIKIK
ncbi:MAG TPA: UvrD-helicase domain-containing protein [Erysipelotrichaceae bacterium]|nr:UvrD-helicase domain-containing protein [Erysipelotrichaceae bacterium]